MAWQKREKASVFEGRLIPQWIYIYIYIYIYISECKNWGYAEQAQRVKWYVNQEAGSKASREDLYVILDKVCCTVVKPWNLLLQMKQNCIVERCMIYIYYICIYHILPYTEYIQDIESVSHEI